MSCRIFSVNVKAPMFIAQVGCFFLNLKIQILSLVYAFVVLLIILDHMLQNSLPYRLLLKR